MSKYRKLPVVIEATQYRGTIEECHELEATLGLRWVPGFENHKGHHVIDTLEGEMRVNLNDWIITGVKGERYPCKPDIFAATYELADPTKAPGYYCTICPHAMFLHNPDGTCSCGIDCAAARERNGDAKP